LEYLLISASRADLWFRLHGLFDALFRLSIPVLIRFYPIDIIYLFPASAFTGLIALTLTFGLLYTSLNAVAILSIICKLIFEDLISNLLNIFIVFSFTSAVVTALQYTVSNRIFEEDRTEQGYIFHVIITSLGTIVGPVIGGMNILLSREMKSIICFIFRSIARYDWKL
jgi:hypothetical protein